jgi:hypothetical protein
VVSDPAIATEGSLWGWSFFGPAWIGRGDPPLGAALAEETGAAEVDAAPDGADALLDGAGRQLRALTKPTVQATRKRKGAFMREFYAEFSPAAYIATPSAGQGATETERSLCWIDGGCQRRTCSRDTRSTTVRSPRFTVTTTSSWIGPERRTRASVIDRTATPPTEATRSLTERPARSASLFSRPRRSRPRPHRGPPRSHRASPRHRPWSAVRWRSAHRA